MGRTNSTHGINKKHLSKFCWRFSGVEPTCEKQDLEKERLLKQTRRYTYSRIKFIIAFLWAHCVSLGFFKLYKFTYLEYIVHSKSFVSHFFSPKIIQKKNEIWCYLQRLRPTYLIYKLFFDVLSIFYLDFTLFFYKFLLKYSAKRLEWPSYILLFVAKRIENWWSM